MEEGQKSKSQELLERIDVNRERFSEKVKELNSMMEDFNNLPSLLNSIYSFRQEISESYYSVISMYSVMNSRYSYDFAKRSEMIRKTDQMYKPSEQYIRSQVEGALHDDKEILSHVENYGNYLESTLKTVDGIIFGIKERVRIEEIKRGLN